MEQDKVVYSGYLLIPPQTKLLMKKTLQQKYCLLYKASKFGIERLELYDNIEDHSKGSARIITLEDCVKITPKGPNHFTIYTKTGTYEFTTLMETALNEWISALQSVAFRDDVSKITSIEEDNDLYCSFGEGVFNVKLHPSDASKRCGLEAKHYTLVLTTTAIQLRSIDNKLLYTWPYCYIRRYGYREGKFTFEAGRKCETGEGAFHLEHSNQQEIFRCVSSKMKSMKKVLNGELTSTIIDCGDNQFHAALSMEARSRSPLPPSPTSSTTLHDIEFSGSDVSIDKHSARTATNVRQPPKKPVRKLLPSQHEQEKDNNGPFEVGRYDEIEYRNHAWRTLGIDDVKHTESNIPEEDEPTEYVSWQRGKAHDRPSGGTSLSKASKVITQPVAETLESYDQLQFFGSTSKLDASAGYKQVIPAPVVPQPVYVAPPSWNDYDEVETNIDGIRLADDSHLGYGIIRKKSLTKQNSDEPNVNHKLYNNEQYAIISKPKRV